MKQRLEVACFVAFSTCQAWSARILRSHMEATLGASFPHGIKSVNSFSRVGGIVQSAQREGKSAMRPETPPGTAREAQFWRDFPARIVRRRQRSTRSQLRSRPQTADLRVCSPTSVTVASFSHGCIKLTSPSGESINGKSFATIPMEELPLDVGGRMERPGILLADDHNLVWQAFKRYLEPEFEVVGAVSDAAQLASVADALKPSVVILEISAPGASGASAGLELKRLLPRAKLIALTANEDPQVAREALELWASGYLLKSADRSELIHAIREVLRGKSYLTPKLVLAKAKSVRLGRSDHQRKLTSRQREVLQLLAEGHTMRETADTLHVTPRTIAFHKYRIMEEFGLQTNSDLVRFAIRERVISAL